MNTEHYMLTCKDREGQGKLITITITGGDQKFRGPIGCCTNAASRNFWRRELAGHDIESVTHVRRIHGHVTLTATLKDRREQIA